MRSQSLPLFAAVADAGRNSSRYMRYAGGRQRQREESRAMLGVDLISKTRGISMIFCVACVTVTAVKAAEIQDDADPGMTAGRLAELILKVDEEAVLEGTTWLFYVEGLETAVVYDISADRMRILVPIGPEDELTPKDMQRMMQANFDSALDARYAIAQGTLWGVFIHPLSTLTDEEFLVGLGQTVNVVLSYGSEYSSGLFMYGNGDSAEIERKRLIEKLKNTIT